MHLLHTARVHLKAYIPSDSISVPFWKGQKYSERVLPVLGVGGRFHCLKVTQGRLRGAVMKLLRIFTVVLVIQLYESVKTQNCTPKIVNCPVCKFKTKNFKGNKYSKLLLS